MDPKTKEAKAETENEGAEGEAPPVMSLRDSIKSAIKEHTEEEEPVAQAAEEKEEEFPSLGEEDNKEEPEETEEKEVKETKPVETSDDDKDAKAPEAWKGEAEWDKTPLSIRKRILKREAEVQNGITQYSKKAQAFDEYEQVLGPRRQHMDRIGVTPVQVVGRALEWMDALGHPDPKFKGDAFRLLAQNYGIDVASLVNPQSTGESQRVTGDNQSLDIEALRSAVRGEVENLTKDQRQMMQEMVANQKRQSDAAAQAFVNEWSKDKSHFAKVKDRMGQLLASGAIPLTPTGTLDLDKAYEFACYENTEIRQLQNLEKAREAKKKAEDKKKKDEKDNKERLAKAKSANGSLKPSSFSPSIQPKKNDAKGLSIRDTIRFSIKESAGAQ